MFRSKGLRVFCLEAGVVLTKIDGCPQKLHQLIVLEVMRNQGILKKIFISLLAQVLYDTNALFKKIHKRSVLGWF